MKKIINPLNNNRGVALLIAIFSLSLMIFIATEVSYDTNVEYVIASQSVNQLKAYYSAKAGVELSLLRILIYKKAIAQFGDQLGESKSMLDPIWSFPFAWPPTNFIPEDDISIVAKSELKNIEKESKLKATYITSIESEGSKIDINDLGSELTGLKKSLRAQLLKIFQNEIENNDEFNELYSDYNFNELINNIEDWVDEDSESLNGGLESSLYQDTLQSDFIPPNQPFKTLEELHMVAGMKDDFYKLLAKSVTIFGIKGININYSDKDMLKALDPQITDEVANRIIKRRSSPDEGGPFKDEEDFVNFVGTLINASDFNKEGIPLLFEPVYNFRITSTGSFANSTSEITAITYDIDSLTSRMVSLLDKQDEEKEKGQNASNGDSNQAQSPNAAAPAKKSDKKSTKKSSPKGQPRIVYWHES